MCDFFSVQVPAERNDVAPWKVQLFGGGLMAEGSVMTEDGRHEFGGALQRVGDGGRVYERVNEWEQEVGEGNLEARLRQGLLADFVDDRNPFVVLQQIQTDHGDFLLVDGLDVFL